MNDTHDAFLRTFFGNLGAAVPPSQFPPFNVFKREVKNGTEFKLEIAVAGFSKEELDVTTDKGQLIITGEKRPEDTTSWEFVEHGIAARKFRKIFTLPADTTVTDAEVFNGILTVLLCAKKTSSRVVIK